ncbi:MAG: hypothetical protein IGS23_07575 [Rivularia sp. T60_A2020_040]|nr:hypothetical protein [Rivularia sp. T60_A2020_040]
MSGYGNTMVGVQEEVEDWRKQSLLFSVTWTFLFHPEFFGVFLQLAC